MKCCGTENGEDIVVYIASKKSKNHIVHTEDCSYVARMNPDNQVVYNSLNNALQAGAHWCKKCSLLYSLYQEQASWIRQYIRNKDMFVQLDEVGLRVRTPYGRWYICQMRNNSLSLYHGNSVRPRIGMNSAIKGYHNQKVYNRDIRKMLTYIYAHDTYRRYNPVEMKKPQILRTHRPANQKGKAYRKKERQYAKAVARRNANKRIQFLFEKLELERA